MSFVGTSESGLGETPCAGPASLEARLSVGWHEADSPPCPAVIRQRGRTLEGVGWGPAISQMAGEGTRGEGTWSQPSLEYMKIELQVLQAKQTTLLKLKQAKPPILAPPPLHRQQDQMDAVN